MREALLDMIDDLPRDASGPVFHEPWEAEAFALTLALYDKGVFSWTEWTEALSQEGAAASHGTSRSVGITPFSRLHAR